MSSQSPVSHTVFRLVLFAVLVLFGLVLLAFIILSIPGVGR